MADFSRIFEEFGPMISKDPASAEVQAQVKKIQDFITENMYKCTDEILYGLGKIHGLFLQTFTNATLTTVNGRANSNFRIIAFHIS